MISRDPAWRKIQLNKILWITGIWVIITAVEFSYNYFILAANDCIPADFNMSTWLMAAVTSALTAGLLGGTVIVAYFENWFRTHSYFKAFTLVIASFTIIFILKLASDQYHPERLGSVELRGKSSEVVIYTL